MRARTAALLCLLGGCFPDADNLRPRAGGPPTGGPPVDAAIGGVGAAGGTAGTAGAGGMGGGPGGAGGAMGGAGGTSGMGGTGGAPPTPGRAEACAEWALATAMKNFTCAPFLSALRYGTPQSYANRLRFFCGLFDLPGATFPAIPYKPCGDALAAMTCEEWFDGVTPPACDTTGTLPEGAVCATGVQCSTDLCNLGNDLCGTCIKAPGPNQRCHQGNCAEGLVCNPNDTCVAPGALGAACDPNTPCRGSLGCNGGRCARLAAVGAACNGEDSCDLYNGALCASTMTCVAVAIGPNCGMRPDGTILACGARGTCRPDRTCLPAAADGAACSTGMEGPQCIWPAVCAGTAPDQRCRVFQPNRTCGQSAAAGRLAEPRHAGLPGLSGAGAVWRALVPRLRDPR
jgi:hypothetical protein